MTENKNKALEEFLGKHRGHNVHVVDSQNPFGDDFRLNVPIRAVICLSRPCDLDSLDLIALDPVDSVGEMVAHP